MERQRVIPLGVRVPRLLYAPMSEIVDEPISKVGAERRTRADLVGGTNFSVGCKQGHAIRPGGFDRPPAVQG